MRPHCLYRLLVLLCLIPLFGFSTDARAQYPAFGDPGAASAAGTGVGLVPVVDAIDGGSIPIGATGQVVIRFRNDGGQPVQTGLIQLYPSSTVSASVASNQCQGVELPSGAECAVALFVKGLQAGPWRLEMLMAHSGRSRLVISTVSGVVEVSGEASSKLTSDIETVPNEIDFGALTSSQKLTQPVVLRNVTSNPVDISDIYIDAAESAGYSLKAECDKLQAGQSCIATVTWSPQIQGRSSGVLVIKHNGPAALSSVLLKGEFTPDQVTEANIFPRAVPGKGLLVASQTEIDFGADISTASAITVSLVNTGDAPITIKDIRLSGSDNGLNYKDTGCAPDMILQPIEACPLTLTWSPTRVGSIFDDIQVLHDGARGVLVLPVRGDASETVSQDQKAIVLSEALLSAPPSGTGGSGIDPDNPDIEGQQRDAAQANAARVAASGTSAIPNPASVLDGYKITSFSPTRAIVNGPGGSRLVFDGEEMVIGGVPWFVVIQKNGIEFLHQGQRILLLFDRSLSTINRVSASSGNNNTAAGAAATTTTTDTNNDG